MPNTIGCSRKCANAAPGKGCPALQLSAGYDDLVLGLRFLDDGRLVASVKRRVTRDERGMPVSVELTIVDDHGDELKATGEVVSLLSHMTTPFFVWVSLVRWRFPDGSEAFGEDQDTWSPGMLRELLPELLAGRR